MICIPKECIKNSFFLCLLTIPLVGTAQGYPRRRNVSYPFYSNSNTTLKTTARPLPSPSKLFGALELRPSWDTLRGTFNSENSAQLGLNLNTWQVSYNQDIDTTASGAQTPDVAHSPIIQDGHLKVVVPNLWTDGTTSFTNEFRGYFPTNSQRRDAGMMTALRNYFIFTHRFSPTVSFSFIEAPILHVYSEAGTDSPTGSSANPVFENRNIVSFNMNLGPTVTLSLPLHFYATKHRDYKPTAANNAEWTPAFFAWPELRWAVSSNLTLGTAYRTNSFFKVVETGTVPGDGGGAFQGILAVGF